MKRQAARSYIEHERDRAVVDDVDTHLGAEPARLHVGASLAELCHDPLDQWLSVLGAGGVDPARPAALVGVAVQRELAHDEDLCRLIVGGAHRERPVHHTGLVVEDPEVPDLVGEPVGLGIGVVVCRADEHAQPRADLSRPPMGAVVADHVDARRNDPLNQTTHVRSLPRSAAISDDVAMSTHTISAGEILVEVEPDLGGRIGQITVAGTPLLVGRSAEHSTALAWGAYPMVPWAGRIRNGQFVFRGVTHQLQRNHGDHAMHGIGLTADWEVSELTNDRIQLGLDMPTDEQWPFGGRAEQTFEVDSGGIRLHMRVTATDHAFPYSFGWHPWFRKPQRLDVHPVAMYRRDRDGIAVDELVAVPDHPWDDCFMINDPIGLTIDDVDIELRSPCDHWVIYDEPDHATCVEPQTGPPDAFTIAPRTVDWGESAETSLWIGVC